MNEIQKQLNSWRNIHGRSSPQLDLSIPSDPNHSPARFHGVDAATVKAKTRNGQRDVEGGERRGDGHSRRWTCRGAAGVTAAAPAKGRRMGQWAATESPEVQAPCL